MDRIDPNRPLHVSPEVEAGANSGRTEAQVRAERERRPVLETGRNPPLRESDAPVRKMTDEEWRERLYTAGRADGVPDWMIEEIIRDFENARRTFGVVDGILSSIFGGR